MAEYTVSCPACGRTWTQARKPGFFCRHCREPLPGAPVGPPVERVKRPGFAMWRLWTIPGAHEDEPRRFALALVLQDADGNAIARDGRLTIDIVGLSGEVEIHVDTAVRREDFAPRTWPGLTADVEVLALVYRHAEPVVPPRPEQSLATVKLTAASGETYDVEWREYFVNDPVHDVAPR